MSTTSTTLLTQAQQHAIHALNNQENVHILIGLIFGVIIGLTFAVLYFRWGLHK